MQKTVWITGGSRGIGAATVHAFANAGWQVAFTYRTNTQAANQLVQQLSDYPVLSIQGNMTSRAQAEQSAAQIRAHFGEIHAVVCNAGIAQQKMFCDLTDADWDTMFNSNIKSVFYTIQACLAEMVHRKAGRIVTVSSIWGITGASCESHYAASKAAVIGLTKSLAQELGPSGIHVNCVAPGVIDTDMNAVHDTDTLRTLAEETPLCRLGSPAEVAQTILFLCESPSSFITGQVLGVSGGFAI